MNIQIYPLDKVDFDNVAICFGMEKSAVELALSDLRGNYNDAHKCDSRC